MSDVTRRPLRCATDGCTAEAPANRARVVPIDWNVISVGAADGTRAMPFCPRHAPFRFVPDVDRCELNIGAAKEEKPS